MVGRALSQFRDSPDRDGIRDSRGRASLDPFSGEDLGDPHAWKGQKVEQGQMQQMELDRDRHRSLPYLGGGGRLHVRRPGGTRRTFAVAEAKAFCDRDLWEIRTDVAEVGVTTDGRWLLVRDCDDGAQVLEFADRAALCRFLWEQADLDPAALHALRQLGALRFDPGWTDDNADGHRGRRHDEPAGMNRAATGRSCGDPIRFLGRTGTRGAFPALHVDLRSPRSPGPSRWPAGCPFPMVRSPAPPP